MLFSATEIANMGLAKVPATRDGVRRKAEKEGWYREERTGRGGTYKVYAIPGKYAQGTAAAVMPIAQPVPSHGTNEHGAACKAQVKVAGTIVGSQLADEELLRRVIVTLDYFLGRNKLTVTPERKADGIIFLYKYMQTGASAADVELALKMVGGKD